MKKLSIYEIKCHIAVAYDEFWTDTINWDQFCKKIETILNRYAYAYWVENELPANNSKLTELCVLYFTHEDDYNKLEMLKLVEHIAPLESSSHLFKSKIK